MSDSSFKNRNLLVLLFEIFLIVVAIGGLTFATSELLGSRTIIKFGEYNVDYIGKTEIIVNDLEPISDSLINYNSYDGVIRLEFSLRGVDTNDEEELVYDIMINDMNIDCSLLNEYTKWNLYKNGELLYNGNFSPKFDGNVLTDNFRLTEMQQDLPRYDDEYDDYVLIIWISEVCEDLTNCLFVDQSNIVNSVMDMNVFIAVSGGEKVLYKRVPNKEAICVNKPVLSDSMIPVYYENGNWRIADKTNNDVDRVWYDYGKSRWANVVLVNEDKYDIDKEGTIVLDEDILAHYVWIPRYKYRLWNSENEITDSYDAYNKGIEIVFESGVNSSGNAKCSEGICGGYNDQYLTHPAFLSDIRGFWISKYELGDSNKSYDEYTNDMKTMYGYEDKDIHIVSNFEWGATLYLGHSKYGKCSDGCDKETLIDSTTLNEYGVYDMNSGYSEYVTLNTGLGSAMNELKLDDNTFWYSYFTYDNYVIRGNDISNVSSRGVIVNK